MRMSEVVFFGCEASGFYPEYTVSCIRQEGITEKSVLFVSLHQHATNRWIVWDKRIPARSLVRVVGYQPLQVVPNVRCPVLIAAACDDTVSPYEEVQRLRECLLDAEMISFSGNHFDLWDPRLNSGIGPKLVDFFRRIFSEYC